MKRLPCCNVLMMVVEQAYASATTRAAKVGHGFCGVEVM